MCIPVWWPFMCSEVKFFALVEEQENMSVEASSFGWKWLQVVAQHLAFIDSTARDVASGKKKNNKIHCFWIKKKQQWIKFWTIYGLLWITCFRSQVGWFVDAFHEWCRKLFANLQITSGVTKNIEIIQFKWFNSLQHYDNLWPVAK